MSYLTNIRIISKTTAIQFLRLFQIFILFSMTVSPILDFIGLFTHLKVQKRAEMYYYKIIWKYNQIRNESNIYSLLPLIIRCPKWFFSFAINSASGWRATSSNTSPYSTSNIQASLISPFSLSGCFSSINCAASVFPYNYYIKYYSWFSRYSDTASRM